MSGDDMVGRYTVPDAQGRPRPMTSWERLVADQPRKEANLKVPHKAKPEGLTWYTVRRGGNWRDACADCPRTVIMTNGEWRHLYR